MSDFNSRRATRWRDDTYVFRREGDRDTEERIAHAIDREWRVSVRSYGELAPIGHWFTNLSGRFLGLLSITSCSYSTKRGYAVLNLRKHHRLIDAAYMYDCLVFYVCEFSDEIMQIEVRSIESRNVTVFSNRRGQSHDDIEPCIKIEVRDMRPLKGSKYQDAWPW